MLDLSVVFFFVSFLLTSVLFFFFFNDTATTEIYTLSLTRRSSDLQFMPLTTDQLDAVYEYLKENQEDVEPSYERILRRSEELRSYYEAQNRARSPFPPEMPLEERRKLMLQKAAAMKASQAKNENHDPARS